MLTIDTVLFYFDFSHTHNVFHQLSVREQIKVQLPSLKDTWPWHITADDCCEDQACDVSAGELHWWEFGLWLSEAPGCRRGGAPTVFQLKRGFRYHKHASRTIFALLSLGENSEKTLIWFPKSELQENNLFTKSCWNKLPQQILQRRSQRRSMAAERTSRMGTCLLIDYK